VPGHLAIWEPDGTFDRLIGGHGDGPGEFRGQVSVFHVDGDSLWVVDSRARTSVLGPDLAVARQGSPGGGDHLINLAGTLFLDDGSILAGVAVPAGEASDRFHVRDRTGSFRRSFGPADPDSGRPFPGAEEDSAILAAAGGSRFWAASPSVYRLELWDTAAVRLRIIEREVSWFKGTSVDAAARTSELPLQLVLIRSDVDGLIWTVAAVPENRRRQRDSEAENHDPYAAYSWRMEVLDPGSGALLASESFSRLSDVPVFSRTGFAYRYHEDGEGARIEIVEVGLQPRGRR